jgi:hypothetical protein
MELETRKQRAIDRRFKCTAPYGESLLLSSMIAFQYIASAGRAEPR